MSHLHTRSSATREAARRPRVVLADDHSLLLDAFEMLLADVCDVVGKVGDGNAAVAAAASLAPDIIVLDIGMPLMNGFESGREIHRRFPQIKLVFLTMQEDAALVAEAFRAGASAYLLKRSAASELSSAIRDVFAGQIYVTSLIAHEPEPAPIPIETPPPSDSLTPRQRRVLQLIAEGRSMKEVAATLNLAPGTVAFHKYRMMEQLEIKSTAELIQYAVRHAIV
jgi:DNA-binding NarL/FixJ family response regulator